MLKRRARQAALAIALAAGPAAAAATAAPAALAADARRGERLFTGELRLANGGAPCLACHGVAGHGLARAASFGPDLTAVHATYGAEGLEAALADVPFPSMAPLYAKHVLTPEERADVTAFLAVAASGTAHGLSGRFALGVFGLATLFVAASVAVGRGRGRARTRRETP